MKPRTFVLILGTLLAMSYDPRTGITSYGDVADSAQASDPVPSTATDFSPYRSYLDYVAGGIPGAVNYVDEADLGTSTNLGTSNSFLSDPSGIFDEGYSITGRRSVNPYFSTTNRDALRDVAARLGLSQSDADRAALEFAQEHFNQFGQGYSDATHPAIVADSIARKLFGQAGVEYQGLSPEQIAQSIADATAFQERLKQTDKDAWKRDPFGSVLALDLDNLQNAGEENLQNPERAFVGAQDPFSTGLWNQLLNKDWDPTISQLGGPSESGYNAAGKDGVDTESAAAFDQMRSAIASFWGTPYAEEASADGIAELQLLANAELGTEFGSTASAAGDSAAGSTGSTGSTTGSTSSRLMSLAKDFAVNLARTGGNVKEALKSTFLNAGVSYAGSAIPDAPSESPLDTAPNGPDSKRRVMLAAADTGTMFDVPQGLFDADTLDKSLIGPLVGAAPGSDSMYAADASPFNADTLDRSLVGPDAGATYGSESQFAPPLAPLNGPGPSEQSRQTPEQKRAQDNAKLTEQFSKFARALAQMNDGDGEPKDAPRRQKDQDDAQYAQTLAQYANLDAQALADAGLTPGTPEYYDYIMQQMDSIIGQVTDGLDPDDATLSDRLRTKTREELDSLERALYVRGQIGQLMGSGNYTDPFTGINEDVIAPEGRTFRPGVAAYHRGLARSADELAAMRPQEARRFLGGMLDRNPDLYGMEASANDRALNEMFASQGEDWKRRRGMLSGR